MGEARVIAAEPDVHAPPLPEGVYPLLESELWDRRSTARPGIVEDPDPNSPLLLALMCVRRGALADPAVLNRAVALKVDEFMRKQPADQLACLAKVRLDAASLTDYTAYALEYGAVDDILDEVQYILESNTADAWVARLSMPPVVFDALDAYLLAFGRPETAEERAERNERRAAWLRVAMDNWHHSCEYGFDAGAPHIPLESDLERERAWAWECLADPDRGMGSLRNDKLNSRDIWARAMIGQPTDDYWNRPPAPPVVRDAIVAYFTELGNDYPTLEGDSTGMPLYPSLHLITETVLRASAAPYHPEDPDPEQWCDGLPTPVKAALDVLR